MKMMYTLYKKTMSLWLAKISCLVFLVLISSCSLFEKKSEIKELTPREANFEKAVTFFNEKNFNNALPLFQKISQQSEAKVDRVYDLTLWYLSVIYEKTNMPEKALLTLKELTLRNSTIVPSLKVRFSQMKNHFRVSNEYQALEVKKLIDSNQPLLRNDIETIYSYLFETTDLNYDHLAVEELQFVGQLQKYFIYVMESSQSPENAQATELLISIYDNFFKILKNNKLNFNFRKKIAIALIDQLRLFDRYKIDDLNVNLMTIAKFSNYSEKKQKLLTDWLYHDRQ